MNYIEDPFVLGFVLFLFGTIAGYCIGRFQSFTKHRRGRSHMSTPSRSQSKLDSPKRKDKSFVSPAKLIHRIASSFLRPNNIIDTQPDVVECTDIARNKLKVILGILPPEIGIGPNVTWQHVYSNPNCQFWVSNAAREGVKLRGETSADSSACSIVNWMLQQDVITGIEGLNGNSEIISRTAANDEIVVVRKVYCKAGSGSIMSSKRDFKLVTSITMEENGAYVIATRSGPWDFESSVTGGGESGTSAMSSGNNDSGQEGSERSRGFIRGIVHASGFILRPVHFDGEVGCEISFGCHLDMKGTRSGRGNTANVNAILASVLRTIKSIHNGEADCFHHLEGQSLQYMERLGTWNKTFTLASVSNSNNSHRDNVASLPEAESRDDSSLLQLDNDRDPIATRLEMLTTPPPPAFSKNLLFNAAQPSTDDVYRLLSVARDAASRLRAQYNDTLGPDCRGTPARTSFSGPFEVRRETFYEQDGIVLKETDRPDFMVVSSLGVLSATFQIQAAPEAVRKLLVYRPDSVDGFVEGRSILSYLSKDTYVQWLAYGAMFPLEAKDFLVVTTLEPWDKKTNEGFVIASTSVDSMCEMGRCVRRNSLTGDMGGTSSGGASSGSESHPQKKDYHRTFLRLSGYVGVPNADGSTSLTFILDLPMEHRRSSASWLLRYLAQYSLTELVGRIRHALSPFSLGDERVLQRIQRSATEVADQEDTVLPGASPLLGGGGTRTADLSRMLASIQNREETAARRCNNIERVPVLNHYRPDGMNNVEYFNPRDEHQSAAVSGRSRLESDGYSIWRDVRSRGNSLAVTPRERHQQVGYELSATGNSPADDSGGMFAGSAHEEARLPPLTPTSRHRKSLSLSGIATNGNGSTPAEITLPPPPLQSSRHSRVKGLSTFQLLKRSLGRKNRKHSRNTAAATTALHLTHPDEDDSSDHHLSTPDCSPRGSERKSMQSHYPGSTPPSSPFVSLPGVAGVGGKLLPRLSRGDDVDLHAVQRELSRISPSRRHSRTEQRRRTLSRSEDAAAVAAALAAAGHNLPLARAVPATAHRSQSSGETVKPVPVSGDNSSTTTNAVSSVPHSHSLNDLPALAARSTAVFVTLQEAWEKYSVYFDEQRAAAQLGIDWQLKLNKPNIHIYSSMVNDNSWCAIKAVTVMRTTPMALVKVLLDYSRMGEYDNMFKTSSLVQQVDANTVIQRLCFKEVWPTAPRDFVVCASWRQNADGTVSIVSRSVSNSYYAHEKPYVRGFLQVSGYLLEPYREDTAVPVPLSCAPGGILAPGECKVTLLNHTELGGTLPASVINVLSTSAPMKILSSLASLVS